MGKVSIWAQCVMVAAGVFAQPDVGAICRLVHRLALHSPVMAAPGGRAWVGWAGSGSFAARLRHRTDKGPAVRDAPPIKG